MHVQYIYADSVRLFQYMGIPHTHNIYNPSYHDVMI